MFSKIIVAIATIITILNGGVIVDDGYSKNELIALLNDQENHWVNTTQYDIQLEHAGIWNYTDEYNFEIDYVYNLENKRLIQWVKAVDANVYIYYSLDNKDYTMEELENLYPGLLDATR